MMYPDIQPNLKMKSTISHPLRPEEVIGFAGRNKMIGRSAVIMKDDALEQGRVLIPTEATQALVDGKGELAVLRGDTVLTMDGTDFATEYVRYDVESRGQTVTMHSVDKDSENFRSWEKSLVEITN